MVKTEQRQHIELVDSISKSLSQLTALLASITGEGFDNFSCLSKENQDNLLWLTTGLANDAYDGWLEISNSINSID